jgi:hypothetical protein
MCFGKQHKFFCEMLTSIIITILPAIVGLNCLIEYSRFFASLIDLLELKYASTNWAKNGKRELLTVWYACLQGLHILVCWFCYLLYKGCLVCCDISGLNQ